jgi:hypothetical protein
MTQQTHVTVDYAALLIDFRLVIVVNFKSREEDLILVCGQRALRGQLS